jgi:hypothetical protein
MSLSESAQRKSKELASKNIVIQSRKRPLDDDFTGNGSSTSSVLPESIYGTRERYEGSSVPEVVVLRDLMRNAMVNTVSKMYFDTTDPFPEILRCLDDRIDEKTDRYVSGIESLLRAEISDQPVYSKKSLKERIVITPLDMIACPFRRKEVIDTWRPLEVALFELGICESRGFSPKRMFELFEGKRSIEELTLFFDEVYSKTDNYATISRLSMKDEDMDSADSAA